MSSTPHQDGPQRGQHPDNYRRESNEIFTFTVMQFYSLVFQSGDSLHSCIKPLYFTLGKLVRLDQVLVWLKEMGGEEMTGKGRENEGQAQFHCLVSYGIISYPLYFFPLSSFPLLFFPSISPNQTCRKRLINQSLEICLHVYLHAGLFLTQLINQTLLHSCSQSLRSAT